MRQPQHRSGASLRLAALTAFVLATVPIVAQQRAAESPRSLTAADYARAEQFMTYNVTPLVLRSGVRPTWLPDDRFWYRVPTETGAEFLLVDRDQGHARAGVRSRQARRRALRRGRHEVRRIASAVSANGHVRRRQDDHRERGAPPLDLRRRRQPLRRGARGAGSRSRPAGEVAAVAPRQPRPRFPRRTASSVAFVRNHNLWVRDVSTGKETQQTTDGIKDFGVRDEQRGLDEERTADSALVAGLEEDRDVPARPAATSARCISSTRGSAIRSSRPGSIRCPATSTSSRSSAWSSTCERAKVVRLQMPARSPSLHALRSHRLPRR